MKILMLQSLIFNGRQICDKDQVKIINLIVFDDLDLFSSISYVHKYFNQPTRVQMYHLLLIYLATFQSVTPNHVRVIGRNPSKMSRENNMEGHIHMNSTKIVPK